MNYASLFLYRQAAWALGLAGGFLTGGFSALAQNVQHLDTLHPGGMPAQPIIKSVVVTNNQAKVTWRGFLGFDQNQNLAPFRLQGNEQLRPGQWQTLAAIYSNNATVPLASSMTFRILGGAPEFAGAEACAQCHTNQHQNWLGTRHARALESLNKIGKGNDQSCLPCHTVGFGMPTGYTNELVKALLGGVQCENCHGPSALHAANPRDFSLRPIKDLAAQVCGGCHQVSEFPTYHEWHGSRHAEVTEDMNPAGRISSCGRCHSGSSRLALMKGEDPAQTVAGDANVAITCAVCHDPHQKSHPSQLRNPVGSTHDYSLATADVFTNKYDPTINICAQCHNHRGASWTSNTRPPHHSPQYNMLIGTVGVLPSGAAPSQPAAHALMITNQCVGCHVQMRPFNPGPPPVHGETGHSFKVENYDSCRLCHPAPELLTQAVMAGASNRVQQVKAWLDLWATTKAPAALRTKYGARAWEFSTPGSLSNPPGVTGSGPTSAEQSQIPENIRKARFNLYLVYYDGSFGVHNNPFNVVLLEAAENWIKIELNQ